MRCGRCRKRRDTRAEVFAFLKGRNDFARKTAAKCTNDTVERMEIEIGLLRRGNDYASKALKPCDCTSQPTQETRS